MSNDLNQNRNKYDLAQDILSGFQKEARIAILMSGKGSNAKNILAHRHWYPNLNFFAIVSDNLGSNAEKLGQEYGIKTIVCTGSVRTEELRKIFFAKLGEELKKLNIEYVIYAGFMKIATKDFVYQFPGINMHPSDLTRVDDDRIPLYRGMDALTNAVSAGEPYVASTLYVVDDTIDAGLPLAVSRHMKILSKDKEDPVQLHEKLKQKGEHHLFPRVLTLLARGLIDENKLPLRAEFDNLDSMMK